MSEKYTSEWRLRVRKPQAHYPETPISRRTVVIERAIEIIGLVAAAPFLALGVYLLIKSLK